MNRLEYKKEDGTWGDLVYTPPAIPILSVKETGKELPRGELYLRLYTDEGVFIWATFSCDVCNVRVGAAWGLEETVMANQPGETKPENIIYCYQCGLDKLVARPVDGTQE